MTSFPGAPRLIKGSIVLFDSETAAVRRVINLRYNPDTLSRTWQVQGSKWRWERSRRGLAPQRFTD